MAKIEPFEKHETRYEEWFEKNIFAFESELQAIRYLLPKKGIGVEIGVGTGRFAVPLAIKIGVEPSKAMRKVAQERDIEVVDGVAEALPFEDCLFDFALMVTTVCFVDNITASFKEALRVIKPGGFFIIGFVDRKSPVGKFYQQIKERSVFYQIATFYSVDELIYYLKTTGFQNLTFTQTIFHRLDKITEVEPTEEGYGEGSFVVVRAKKPSIQQ
ncbi:MAG: class I SAM-dependent methyltransferase [Thermodesulfobacteriota bacterium]